jgi:hypothetical protein
MATVTMTYSPASGRDYVTLTSWAGTLSFSVTPVAGDQLEFNNVLTVALDGTFTGPSGTYTFHLITANGTVYTAAKSIATVDNTPPTLIAANATVVSSESISWSVNSNEAGGVLYILSSGSATEANAAILASPITVVPTQGANSGTITGLTELTGYYVHFLQEDGSPQANVSNSIRTALVTTPATSPAPSTTMSYIPPAGLTYIELETGFDNYNFESWPAGEPAVGWQFIFNPSEVTFFPNGDIEANTAAVFDFWVVDLAGITYKQTADNLGLTNSAGASVTSVAVPAAGTYLEGTSLTFTVTYTLAVTVTGVPRIPLTIGGATLYADYVSGTGTTDLVFTLVVPNGYQEDTAVTTASIELNGGTLIDSAGDVAGTALLNVASTTGVLVDSLAPVGTVNSLTTNQTRPALSGTVDDTTATVVVSPGSVSATNNADGTWSLAAEQITALTAGNNTITAVFTDSNGLQSSASTIVVVNVTTVTVAMADVSVTSDTPTLSGTCNANNALIEATVNGTTYSTTVAGGAWSLVVTTPLAPNTYTVSILATDTAGNTGTDTAQLTVQDVSIPYVLDVETTVAGAYTIGNMLFALVYFSEPVVVTGAPTIPLQVGTNSRVLALVSGSGSNALLFSYAIVAGDAASVAPTLAELLLNGGSIQDSSGNEALITVAGTEMSGVVVVTEAPTVTVNSSSTINQTPLVTGTVQPFNAGLLVVVNGVDYHPIANATTGVWEQVVGTLNLGQYDVTVTATSTLLGLTSTVSGSLIISPETEVSDPNEPDRLSQAVLLLKRRLGRYTDNPTELDTFILDELKAAQNRLENKTSLPWFLKTRLSGLQTVVGEERIVIPYNWLRVREDWEKPVQILKDGLWRNLPVYSYEKLWENTTAVPDLPVGCAQDGGDIVLGPPPAESYPIKLGYFKREFVLVTGTVVSNGWLKYAFDLIISEAGFILANNYLKNAEAAGQFRAEIQRAEQDLRMTTIAYETAAMESWELNNGR